MRVVHFILLAAMGVMLSACGSSKAVVSPMPLPAGPLLSFESLAKTPNSTVISSATATTTPQVVISEGVVGDGNIQVTVGSTVYDLTGSQVAGVPFYTGTQAGMTAVVKQIALQTDALLAFTQVGDGSVRDLSGYSVMGNRTPPSEIAALAGPLSPSAIYNGISELVATHEDGFLDAATGDLVMDVDFTNLRVSGSMTMASSVTTGINNFEITAVDATFSGSITQNGDLTAVVDVSAGDKSNFPNGSNQLGLDTSVSGSMTGSLFGPNAQEVGGDFNFTGTEQDGFTGDPLKKIVVQGGYLGNKQ